MWNIKILSPIRAESYSSLALGQMSTVAASPWQQPCYFQRAALHSIPLTLQLLHPAPPSVMVSEPWEGVNIDVLSVTDSQHFKQLGVCVSPTSHCQP